MRPAYIQPFVRFALAVLLLLLATVLLHPDLTGLKDVTLSTMATVGRYVLYAVPVALLFGVPAGLRPGSLLDRLLQLPVVMLAGMPAVSIGLLLLYVAGQGPTRPFWLTELGAALVAAPWLARALRMGLAAAHGNGVRPATLACLGRVLQQFGNLAVCVLPLDAMMLGTGPAAMIGSSSAATAVIGLALPAVVSHLVGDLLVTAAEGAEPEELAERPFFRLMAVGAILTGGLLIAGLNWIGTVSLVGAATAVTCGTLLGLLSAGSGGRGRIATHELEAPSLLGPFVVGLWMVAWLKLSWWAVGVGVGLAMAPWIAPAIRRGASAPAALRGPRGRAVAGRVITLLARALYVEMLLGWALLAPALPLDRALAGALGVAGLNLVGLGLTAEK